MLLMLEIGEGRWRLKVGGTGRTRGVRGEGGLESGDNVSRGEGSRARGERPLVATLAGTAGGMGEWGLLLAAAAASQHFPPPPPTPFPPLSGACPHIRPGHGVPAVAQAAPGPHVPLAGHHQPGLRGAAQRQGAAQPVQQSAAHARARGADLPAQALHRGPARPHGGSGGLHSQGGKAREGARQGWLLERCQDTVSYNIFILPNACGASLSCPFMEFMQSPDDPLSPFP